MRHFNSKMPGLVGAVVKGVYQATGFIAGVAWHSGNPIESKRGGNNE